jgi:hypothetical protein
LDLYLMGLIGPEEVSPFQLLRNRQLVDPAKQLYQAQATTFTIHDVIAACGPRTRRPTKFPVEYRMAMVVVSTTPEDGEAYAKKLDDRRPIIEAAFARATQNRATLITQSLT